MNRKFYLNLVRWLKAAKLVLQLAKLLLEVIGTTINYCKIHNARTYAKVAQPD